MSSKATRISGCFCGLGSIDPWFAFLHRAVVYRYYTEVLREQVVKVAKASGAKVYLATISVIGEEVNNTNHAKIITCMRTSLRLLVDSSALLFAMPTVPSWVGWLDIVRLAVAVHLHLRAVQMPKP